VTRIDIASRRVVHTIDVGLGPSAIAVGMGSVWVVNSKAGTVSRIDPETNQSQTIQVGAAPRGVVVARTTPCG
jgi:YVTN family beta-propeller protein